ncbi:hypothetical protein G3I40_36765 [Streptomyces sp. SID14478]|uniref:hypothetical protein n=1 Tax=Streptomyces sp. SID14478 TaxID=2706073 RepID=UPI0013E0D610|nr:hypothetical protein [Streptomyces sp. SID14478]NEB80723.1 hypothetical protein [Streptomyces sp. SID14478]
MRDEAKYREDLERHFLAETYRYRKRGLGLLGAGGLLWLYVALRLVLPWSVLGADPDCGAPLFERLEDGGFDSGVRHACAASPWPTLLAVLLVSVPLLVTGAALYVRGVVSANLSHYVRSMTR